MTDKVSLKRTIKEGHDIDSLDYSKSYQIYSAKTFYFFIKRIVEYENSPLSSDRLRRYIREELRKSGVKTGGGFNPEGWFGALWTYSLEGIWQNFRPEYTDVLKRIGNDPYEYSIRPEKYNLIKEILQEIEADEIITVYEQSANSTTSPSVMNQNDEDATNPHEDITPLEVLQIDPPLNDITYPDEIREEVLYSEGNVKSVLVNRYERNQSARRACLEYYGAICFVCGFNFEEVYGAIAKGYIHVHHLVPLSTTKESYEINPIKDLRPICPNCHAVIHLEDPPLSIEELQKIIRSST